MSLKGTQSIAEGNAPRKLVVAPAPERVAPVSPSEDSTGSCWFDPFRVGAETSLTGAVPPAINFMPFRHVQAKGIRDEYRVQEIECIREVCERRNLVIRNDENFRRVDRELFERGCYELD